MKAKITRTPQSVGHNAETVRSARRQLPEGLEGLKRKESHQRLVSWAKNNAPENREFNLVTPLCDYPYVEVEVPSEWPYVNLVGLYDVHLGAIEQDSKKYIRDLEWIEKEPYTLVFNGGDLWDNAIKSSIASSFSNNVNPNQQFSLAQDTLRYLFPKMIFGLPGNHEDRTARFADIDVPRILHDGLGIPYSPDYMLCTIKWRDQRIRLIAHHGTGAANNPGGQRNAARKDTVWAHGFDIYWTGHLHQALVDPIEVAYFDQRTNLPVGKTVYSIISPSYLRYFGGYAAKKRLAPGARGLTVVQIQPDGRLDTETHANGARL